MMIKLAMYSIGALALVGCGIAAPASAYSGQTLARHAKVSMAQARKIALKAHPGRITSEELERERGGSGLRYSFDIKSSTGLQEVGIDAKTGAVLENDRESGHPD